jgi:enterochelin esterase-like enzyme
MHDPLLVSPRLNALRRRLHAGDSTALDTFWREVAEEGTPLIEPIPGEDNHRLITFLWREEPGQELRNVVVGTIANLAGPGLENNLMDHLLGTDLWFRTYRVPSDLRLQYRLAPNDSLVPLLSVKSEDKEARMANWQLDPLNRHPYRDDTVRYAPYPDDLPWSSTVTLPDAPSQPWIIPNLDVPRGNLETHQFTSAILGYERPIYVYTPPGYTPDGEPYPLLISFDGQSVIYAIPLPTILDNLQSANLLPPLVAILIGNLDQASRDRELARHPPFFDFLTQELLPWARQRWHFTTDPARTVIAGISRGGLAAAWAGLRHPDLFGNVLGQAGTYNWLAEEETDDAFLIEQYRRSPRLPLRFWLDVGTLETVPLPYMGGLTTLEASRLLRDTLREKGYPVAYSEFCGAHDYFCWQGTISDGLVALFNPDNTARREEGAR